VIRDVTAGTNPTAFGFSRFSFVSYTIRHPTGREKLAESALHLVFACNNDRSGAYRNVSRCLSFRLRWSLLLSSDCPALLCCRVLSSSCEYVFRTACADVLCCLGLQAAKQIQLKRALSILLVFRHADRGYSCFSRAALGNGKKRDGGECDFLLQKLLLAKSKAGLWSRMFLDGVGVLTSLGVGVGFFYPTPEAQLNHFFTCHSKVDNSCRVPRFPLITFLHVVMLS